ncbi:SGNH/GDSL hydrolase family protein [Nonomuraea sp. NPDC050022]|uniref:SGNH/GDSL hydrolase family protein n=1 Tax=unclassified Nonomuraea TaxID=2593643 RepID=UPI0033EF2486
MADSISMHYGPYLEAHVASWCDYSRKTETIGAIKNVEGSNGQDSSMVLTYLGRCQSQQMRWGILLLNCGLWDIRDRNGSRQVPILQYKTNLERLFILAADIGDQIVWIRTTPVDDARHNAIKNDYKRHDSDVQAYNAIADTIARGHGARIIDLYQFCKDIRDEPLYADHIHFTNNVRKLQGAFIAGYLAAAFMAA